MMNYTQAHDNVRKVRGPASEHPCFSCGSPAKNWAFQYEHEPEMRDPEGRPYSSDPSHYEPLCLGCHKRYDLDHDPRVKESSRVNGQRMGLGHAARLKSDSEFAARRSQENSKTLRELNLAGMPGREKAAEAAAAVHRTRVSCSVCGYSSSPGWVKQHQNKTGHL